MKINAISQNFKGSVHIIDEYKMPETQRKELKRIIPQLNEEIKDFNTDLFIKSLDADTLLINGGTKKACLSNKDEVMRKRTKSSFSDSDLYFDCINAAICAEAVYRENNHKN